MKKGDTQLNVETSQELKRLLKSSCAAAGWTMEQALAGMFLYFTGFAKNDREIRQKQRIMESVVQAVTEGKRPFEGGAA